MSGGGDASEDDPFAWMRPFKSRPADLSEAPALNEQYAPPARDPALRRAQEEQMLADEIWRLALSEAYAARNLAWFRTVGGRERHEIIADFYRRHPPMQRFVAQHIANGTCADGVRAIQDERARRRNGEEADLVTPKPSQDAVDRWMLDYYAAAHAADHEPPKREQDAFPSCRQAIGARDGQMRIAWAVSPKSTSAHAGVRDRQ